MNRRTSIKLIAGSILGGVAAVYGAGKAVEPGPLSCHSIKPAETSTGTQTSSREWTGFWTLQHTDGRPPETVILTLPAA